MPVCPECLTPLQTRLTLIVLGLVFFVYCLGAAMFLYLYRTGAFSTRRASSRSVLERLNS